ncbi:MAG: peptidase M75 [Bacteroidales bacterium]|nr:peptidase M75 [Bacteroidales bacterium]
MKSYFQLTIVAIMAFAGIMTSCNHGGSYLTDEKQAAILKQYVDHTIAPTYNNLANQTEQLVNDLRAFRASHSQTDLNKACNTFLTARAWWEKSEAFLFGAASDFGIDPHIDSWPLDVDAFNTMMSNTAQIQAMDAEDGDVYAGEKLGNSLLGFHGIEYILFRDGNVKSASEITDLQMIYAIAVAGDLRNRCYQLEVSWIGDDAPASHRAKVEELELNSTVNGGSYSYGENLMKAGTPGSTYISTASGLMAIVDGCKTIADEVGTSKIGKPYNGEDIHYIESPYSQRSIEDFLNNIISIEYAYHGGVEGSQDESNSLHGYMKAIDSDLDNRVVDAINLAKAKIQAMPMPFVNNYTDPANAAAIEACQALDDILSEVNTTIRNNQ